MRRRPCLFESRTQRFVISTSARCFLKCFSLLCLSQSSQETTGVQGIARHKATCSKHLENHPCSHFSLRRCRLEAGESGSCWSFMCQDVPSQATPRNVISIASSDGFDPRQGSLAGTSNSRVPIRGPVHIHFNPAVASARLVLGGTL